MEIQRAETGLPQRTGHVLGSHPPNGPNIKHPQETIVQQGISQYVGPFRCFFLGGDGTRSLWQGAEDGTRRKAGFNCHVWGQRNPRWNGGFYSMTINPSIECSFPHVWYESRRICCFSMCFWLATHLPFGLVGIPPIIPISGKSLWCITGVIMLVAIINPSWMWFMKRCNLTSYHWNIGISPDEPLELGAHQFFLWILNQRWVKLVHLDPSERRYLPLFYPTLSLITGWWFGSFFIFHNMWDNPSHWLSYFARWLLHHQPETLAAVFKRISPLRQICDLHGVQITVNSMVSG